MPAEPSDFQFGGGLESRRPFVPKPEKVKYPPIDLRALHREVAERIAAEGREEIEARSRRETEYQARFESKRATSRDRRYAIAIAFARAGVYQEYRSESSDYYIIRRTRDHEFRVRVSDHDPSIANDEVFGNAHVEIDVGGGIRTIESHLTAELSLDGINELVQVIVSTYMKRM